MPVNNYKIDFNEQTGEFKFYHETGPLFPGGLDEAVQQMETANFTKEFGKFSIDKLLQILTPEKLIPIFGRKIDAALDRISANPRAAREQQSKYFKLCQEIIVYLDMLKDGFHPDRNREILRKLNLFPTLGVFVQQPEIGRWPHYDSNPKNSDLYKIEDIVYTHIEPSMETRHWKRLTPNDPNQPAPSFIYDEIIRDHGCLGVEEYVKKPGGRQAPDIINNFGTYIDAGKPASGSESNWHENVNESVHLFHVCRSPRA